MLGVGGWLCRRLALADLEATGPGRVRVATPGVCIRERRRIGGCRDISELERDIGALSGCTAIEARRQAGVCISPGLTSAPGFRVWHRGRGGGDSCTRLNIRWAS